jgi:hypothetical protein
VLVAGALRYVFVAGGLLCPALSAPLPPSFRRKAACVAIGIALVIGLVPAVPDAAAGVFAGGGVLAVVYSFAADTVWLLRRRRPTPINEHVTCGERGAVVDRSRIGSA